ncbi:small conjugating protein ligase [Galdieria sulphuraria]|uniref:Small conjugating protein ligase n=1 Tax=Galdieria sulphuraria TaxID=130081 RepID=M2VWN1_GALSU|nr:small conjugating protein ligase [Galdieria sulphuraria]EME27656.1 small conjugating protein ligase [Galdieria sulphuraria]|eukprot:XP_005704176.1 small conjugating protein ligase [Galdieria sulphuraria]
MNILKCSLELPIIGNSSCCFGFYTLDCNNTIHGLRLRQGRSLSSLCKNILSKSLSRKENKLLLRILRKKFIRITQGPFLYPNCCMEESCEQGTYSTVVTCEKKEVFDSLEASMRDKSCSKSPQRSTLQDRNLRRENSCGQQVVVSDKSIFQDFDILELLNRRNSTFSLKAISLSEKLVVVLADLISDYLVLDMLCRIRSLEQAAEFTLGALVAYFLADLFSGLYNWLSANYLSDSFRWSRNALRYYQWHVERPEEIVQMNFFDNVYSHCLIIVPFLLLTAYLRSRLSLFVESVLVFLLACIAIWPELHKWSHMEDSNKSPPVIVRTLQQLGVILNAKDHKGHHKNQLFYHMKANGRWLSRAKFYIASASYSTKVRTSYLSVNWS